MILKSCHYSPIVECSLYLKLCGIEKLQWKIVSYLVPMDGFPMEGFPTVRMDPTSYQSCTAWAGLYMAVAGSWTVDAAVAAAAMAIVVAFPIVLGLILTCCCCCCCCAVDGGAGPFPDSISRVRGGKGGLGSDPAAREDPCSSFYRVPATTGPRSESPPSPRTNQFLW